MSHSSCLRAAVRVVVSKLARERPAKRETAARLVSSALQNGYAGTASSHAPRCSGLLSTLFSTTAPSVKCCDMPKHCKTSARTRGTQADSVLRASAVAAGARPRSEVTCVRVMRVAAGTVTLPLLVAVQCVRRGFTAHMSSANVTCCMSLMLLPIAAVTQHICRAVSDNSPVV